MEGEIDNIFEVSSSMASALLSNGSTTSKKALMPLDLFTNLYVEVSKISFDLYNNSFKVPKLSIDTILEAKSQKPYAARDKLQTEKQRKELFNFDSMPDTDSREALECSSSRLKRIKSLIETNGRISHQVLKRNVDYFINVLDMAFKSFKNSNNFDDSDLSDYLSDTDSQVPNEVLKWLSTTFTRRTNLTRKPTLTKFKSVAHAIRAGIMVDRMFRRMSSSLHYDSHISDLLRHVDEWNFDIFKFDEVSDRSGLRHLTLNLFERYSLMQKFTITSSSMHSFLDRIVAGYERHHNSYHNSIHAADVLQTTFNILSGTGLMNWLNDLEMFAVFFSAIIHDYEHNGATNNFHIQSKSNLAVVYNDRAVLENYHISSAFRILLDADCDILHDLNSDAYKEFRLLVIEIVLATDMSFHFTQLKTLRSILSIGDTIDKIRALSLIVHCADISHPTKEWSLHELWTTRLMQEYFRQGDCEKECGLACSPLCDRTKTPVALSQIGFINFIVDPSFVLMGDMIDKIFEQILREDSNRQSNSDIDEFFVHEIKPKLIHRPWAEHLLKNKEEWQQKATLEMIESEK